MFRVLQPANEQVELGQSRRQMVVQNNQRFLFDGAGLKRASTQPSGSSQSRGMTFQSTQVNFCWMR
jgi:hypothetical protein